MKGVPFKKIEARKRFHFYIEKNEKFSRVEICHVLGNASLVSIKFQVRTQAYHPLFVWSTVLLNGRYGYEF